MGNVIHVQWNQYALPLTSENYAPYNESNTSVSFSDGIATQTWLKSGGWGYGYTIRPNQLFSFTPNDVFYFSYEICSDFDGIFGVEVNSVVPPGIEVQANQWKRLSFILTIETQKNSRYYIPDARKNHGNPVGSTCKVKNVFCINLTHMFGAGNEPTSIEQFESECIENGINLHTQYNQDVTGTSRNWFHYNGVVESAEICEARRRIIMNSPHIEATSGSIASFKSDIKAPLKSVKAYFSPIQSGTGDPSPDNVRPISGHDGITLTHTGVNLLQCDTFANGSQRNVTFTRTRNSDGEIESISVVGTANAQNLFCNLNYVNGEYKWPPYGNRIATFTYCDDIDIIPAGPDRSLPDDIYGADARSYLGRTWRVFDLIQDWPSSYGEWFRLQGVPYQSNGVTYNSIARPMVCVYDDMGCDFEPYKGKDITVSWQTEAGTVIRGYIDLISGELVKTHDTLTLTGNDKWHVVATNKFYFEDLSADTLDYPSDTGEVSNMYPYSGAAQKGSSAVTVDHSFYLQHTLGGKTTYNRVWVYDSNYTLATFKEMLNSKPLKVTYKLLNPVRYQLTSQELKTFIGRNNLWSSAKENIEVKYWTH